LIDREKHSLTCKQQDETRPENPAFWLHPPVCRCFPRRRQLEIQKSPRVCVETRKTKLFET
jgi:hypothetical protein